MEQVHTEKHTSHHIKRIAAQTLVSNKHTNIIVLQNCFKVASSCTYLKTQKFYKTLAIVYNSQ